MTDVPEMPPQMVQAYKDAVDNLIFAKKQQWQIANYLLIAQAALYLLSKNVSVGQKPFLEFSSFAATLLAIVAIWTVQQMMTKFRNRLAFIYQTYFAEEHRLGLQLNPNARTIFYDPFVVLLLTVVCIIGGGAVAYLM